MSKIGLCLMVTLLLAMALPAAAQGDSWADRISLNGYFQTRYEARDWEGGIDQFVLNRLYVTAVIKANERTTGIITWTRIGPDIQGQSNVDWANIFVDYAVNDQWTARIGQAPCWFGLECWEGSDGRLGLERAAFLAGVYGNSPVGMYFAGPWDEGIWLRRNPSGSEPMVVLGVCNGQFRGADATHNKNVSVDLKWNPDWGQFGASWLDGELSMSSSSNRSALLGYVRWSPPGSALGFQAEYMQGELFGADIDGWYGQVSYTGLTEGGTAFVKYEEYDPDTDSSGNEYDAIHVGYAQHLDPNNKVTVQYTNGENKGGCDTNANQIAVQWQMGFR